MTEDERKEQDKIFADSKSTFKLGDKVQHKANPEFKMVVVDFDNKWAGNLSKSGKFKNPEFPACKYYNVHEKKWVDRQVFNYFELELDGES